MFWVKFGEGGVSIVWCHCGQFGESVAHSLGDCLEASGGVGTAFVEVLELLVCFQMNLEVQVFFIVPVHFHVEIRNAGVSVEFDHGIKGFGQCGLGCGVCPHFTGVLEAVAICQFVDTILEFIAPLNYFFVG